MKYQIKALIASVALGLSGATLAAEFSADTLQKGAQGAEMQGRMYVSGERVRSEMTQNGQQMVQIMDPAQGVQWTIVPAQRAYMEQQGQPKAAVVAGQPVNPCVALPGASCRTLGEEAVSGRSTVKWEINLVDREGNQQTMLQWIDKERSIPLRSEISGVQVTELRMLGQETLEGRPVEKWEMTMKQANQDAQTSLQWFDPELKLAVREEFPGGYVRELRNIQVGKQAEELFQVPAGFKKMTPPPQGQQ